MRGDVDIVFVMRLNPSLCQQVALIARKVGASLVYDFWVSRALVAERDGLDVGAARRLESQVARTSTLGLTLTPAYTDYYSEKLDCSPSKFAVVPLAVLEQWLKVPVHPHRNRREFIVAYWGNFLPQHGVQSVLLEAARQLRSYGNIVFRLYGNAKNGNPVEMVREHPNVQYCGFPNLDELIAAVDVCDVCVGHLRPVHDAELVLPNKALEGMARRRPVIHIEAPPLSALYGTSESPGRALQFFSGGASGLVESILKLRSDPELRFRIGRNGRRAVERENSPAATRRQLEAVIDRLRIQRR